MMDETHTSPILLSCKQMAAADAFTIKQGTPGITLMERAGRGVADVAEQVWRDSGGEGTVLILCGPGNNGGDGYVVARRLAMASIPIRVAQFGDLGQVKGDAVLALEKCPCAIEGLDGLSLAGVSLVVDALFGAGLSKIIKGAAATVIKKINKTDIPVIAIDVPSGLDGDKARAEGEVFKADHTVTFHTKKSAHLLFPGRSLCGEVHVIDIGINPAAFATLELQTYENIPELWRSHLPRHRTEHHKYHRGHVMVLGGKAPTLGACRLTSIAALRTGAGLVSLMAPKETYDIQAAALDDVMVTKMINMGTMMKALQDVRITAVAMGPGAGSNLETKKLVLKILRADRAVVLDADALTCFESASDALFNAIISPTVLTPHAGEFQRLFPDIDYGDDKFSVARTAAKRSGAVVVLKGADTVIASPCGRAAVNSNAPPHLSVGGTGDVLTGMIVALLGAGMPAFESACAAVWIHSCAADSYSLGMIASDLLKKIPQALQVAQK